MRDKLLGRFDDIDWGKLPEQVASITSTQLTEIENLCHNTKQKNWHNFISKIDDLQNSTMLLWQKVEHLHSVADNEVVRTGYEQSLPIMTAYFNKLSQLRPLYEGYQQVLAAGDDLTPERIAQLELTIKNFKLHGIDLPVSAQKQLEQIKLELSQLTNKFANNVLDASQSWHLYVSDKKELAGIPDYLLAKFYHNAKRGQTWLQNRHRAAQLHYYDDAS